MGQAQSPSRQSAGGPAGGETWLRPARMRPSASPPWRLDQGPIIEQDVVRVTHRDEAADLVRKGRDLERQVLARPVRLRLQRRVLVDGRRTIIFG